MKIQSFFPFRKSAAIAAVALTLIGFGACQKDLITPNSSQVLTIKLNDKPVQDLTNVWIDVKYVEVKIDTSNRDMMHGHDDNFYRGDKDDDDKGRGHDEFGIWDTIAFNPGVYDLLALRNGLDTTLASGTLPAGRIHKVRITLGTESAVSKDSGATRIPLSICSGEPYVYVMLERGHMHEHHTNQFELSLDFDLANSISEENGTYCLKPVVHPYNKFESGRIEGKVLPLDAKALPMAFNGTDIFYAKPDEADGKFKICGMKPGVYSVKFNPAGGYKDTLITGIVVKANEETEIHDVILQK